ncbi:MAG: methionyl-tRNA formyltransferase [Rhodospirillales bacterium]|nr:methionyl-tRNA formyltransferase [Rhodospirillales bacterium]
MSPLRLVFMGSPDFAIPVLSALIDSGHDLAAVYSQPPKPAGRGHKEKPCPVHAFAAERGIPVRTPRSLKKSEEEQQAFADLGADLAVTAAYGLILPKAVLEAPRLGCINVHASLLPRWRGAAPIQRAILAGDGETGVTIMQVDEGLDTGPILLAGTVPITQETTGGSLHDELAELGARLTIETIDGLQSGALRPRAQPEDGTTYAHKLERGESRIDWSRSAAEVERGIRAFEPWPGAWFEHQGTRIKVRAATVIEDEAGARPGTVLGPALTVMCGDGALRVDRLQREGKAATDTESFLRGYELAAGTLLE